MAPSRRMQHCSILRGKKTYALLESWTARRKKHTTQHIYFLSATQQSCETVVRRRKIVTRSDYIWRNHTSKQKHWSSIYPLLYLVPGLFANQLAVSFRNKITQGHDSPEPGTAQPAVKLTISRFVYDIFFLFTFVTLLFRALCRQRTCLLWLYSISKEVRPCSWRVPRINAGAYAYELGVESTREYWKNMCTFVEIPLLLHVVRFTTIILNQIACTNGATHRSSTFYRILYSI